jgi:hypothetical protein
MGAFQQRARNNSRRIAERKADVNFAVVNRQYSHW